MGFKIKAPETQFSFRLEFNDLGSNRTLDSMLKVMASSQKDAFKKAVKIAHKAVKNDPEFKGCVGPIEIRFYTEGKELEN